MKNSEHIKQSVHLTGINAIAGRANSLFAQFGHETQYNLIGLLYQISQFKNNTPVSVQDHQNTISDFQKNVDSACWIRDSFSSDVYIQKLNEYVSKHAQDIFSLSQIVEMTDFLLFLKKSFAISHFDMEENNYPEHDLFFLSDDNAYLFEYTSADFDFSLIKTIFKAMFGQFPTEKIKDIFDRLIYENLTILEEEAYQERIGRLSQYGHCNYEEALEWISPLSDTCINQWKNKKMEHEKILIPKSEVWAKNNQNLDEQSNSGDNSFWLSKTISALFEIKKAEGHWRYQSGTILEELMSELLLKISIGKNWANEEHLSLTVKDFYRIGHHFYKGIKSIVKMCAHDSILENTIGSQIQDINFYKNSIAFMGHNYFINNAREIKCLGNLIHEIHHWIDSRKNEINENIASCLNYDLLDLDYSTLLMTWTMNKLIVNMDSFEPIETKYLQMITTDNFQEEQLQGLGQDLVSAGYEEIAKIFTKNRFEKLIEENIGSVVLSNLNREDYKFIGGVLLTIDREKNDQIQ